MFDPWISTCDPYGPTLQTSEVGLVIFCTNELNQMKTSTCSVGVHGILIQESSVLSNGAG